MAISLFYIHYIYSIFIWSNPKNLVYIIWKKLFLILQMFWRQLGTWLLNFRNINLIKFCFFIFCNRFQFTNCVRLKTNNWHLSLFFSFIVLNLNYGIQLICFFTYYDLSFILVVDILDLFIYFWNFFQVTCNFLSALSSFPALVFLGGILFLFLR